MAQTASKVSPKEKPEYLWEISKRFWRVPQPVDKEFRSSVKGTFSMSVMCETVLDAANISHWTCADLLALDSIGREAQEKGQPVTLRIKQGTIRLITSLGLGRFFHLIEAKKSDPRETIFLDRDVIRMERMDGRAA